MMPRARSTERNLWWRGPEARLSREPQIQKHRQIRSAADSGVQPGKEPNDASGDMLLNHFADRMDLLELDWSDCDVQKSLDTRVIAANHTGFLSVPELRRIGVLECTRGSIDCRARFPRLERLFATSSPPAGPATRTDSEPVSPMALLRDIAQEDSK